MTDFANVQPIMGWLGFVRTRDLEAELHRAGIKTIPMDRVSRHIEKDVFGRRPTKWHHALAIIGDIIWFLTLAWIIELLMPKVRLEKQYLLGLVLAGVAAVFAVTSQTPLWAALPFGAWLVVALNQALGETRYQFLLDVQARWRFHHPKALKETPCDAFQLIERVRSDLPDDARVKILGTASDPFVVVMLGRWFWKQMAVVGAWSTGDDELNTLGPCVKNEEVRTI